MEKFTLIIGLLLSVVISVWGIYFKSYFIAKGKNDATKEDIAKITKAIEETKQDFNVHLEKVKSNFSLFTNQSLSLATEKRNAIYNFNDEYYRWYNTTIDLYRVDFEKEDGAEFAKGLIKAKLVYSIASSRILIFYSEKEFLTLKNKIETLTQQLSNLNAECFLMCHNLKHQVKMNELIEPSTPIDDSYQNLAKAQMKVIDDYSEKQRAIASELKPHLEHLRSILGNYITEILTYKID